MHTANLLSSLSFHCADNVDERIHLKNIIAFVERNSQRWWQRTTLDGHITASAWVLSPARTHALLLHHAKLNCWLQPGGHLDDDDASPASGALREAHEETGMTSLQLVDENIFDIDVHAIPERGHEPAHLHYDLRYLIISPDSKVTLSGESLGARWIALDELVRAPFERSISRMAEKSLPHHSK
jgi:8-oxo-dGTP pyrophosphatase MutT (NUDIX family)